jgi:MFS family permease
MEKKGSRKAWLITIVCILAGAMFAFGLQKVPPVMGLVIPYFQIGNAQAATLISVCSLMGVIMAVPAGALVLRFGPRVVGIAALVITFAGNVTGALCTSYDMLLVTRVIEGIGFGCVNVICPVVIEKWFSQEKRGLPMAIWSCWMSFGILFAFNIANLACNFNDISSWHNLWWVSAALFVIVLVLFILIVRMPKEDSSQKAAKAAEAAARPKAKFADGIKSPATWLLGICFAVFSFGIQVLITFSPSYSVSLGIDMETANSFTGLLSVGCIVGGFVMGFILNKFARRRLTVLMVSMVCTAIVFALIFSYQASWVVAFMLVGGFVLQMVPACAFSLAPDTTMNPKTMGVVMGVVIILENLGAVVGGPVVGGLLDMGGFGTATVFLIGLGVFGIVMNVVYNLVQRKLYAQQVALVANSATEQETAGK